MTDFIEPFGLVLHKDVGTDTFKPAYVQLPVGVNTLLVTLPGNKDVIFSIFRSNNWSSALEHITIPAGTKNWVHTIGVRAGEPRFIAMTSWPGVSDEMRATVTVTTIPLYGA